MPSPALMRIQARRGITAASEGGPGAPSIIGPPNTRGVGVGGSVTLQAGGSTAGAAATGQLALSTLVILILGLVGFHVWTREFQA